MHTKEFKIGVFVVAVLTASFFLINYLRGQDIFNREIELSAYYDELEGLTVSAPVYIKGYKAGKVTDVEYQQASGDFRVTCSVRKEFPIPEDSRMTIYSVDIMGGKGVRIDQGTSDSLAEDGDELTGDFEAGLMDGLSEGVGPLLAKVNRTLDSLNVTISGANSILSGSNAAKISLTLTHLERTMLDVRNLAASIGGKSAELDSFIDNLVILSDKMNGIADNADSLVTGISEVVVTLNDADIEGVVGSFKALLEKINDPDGTIGKLLTDDSVYESVDELLKDIDSLVSEIEKNPKKYIKISVF